MNKKSLALGIISAVLCIICVLLLFIHIRPFGNTSDDITESQIQSSGTQLPYTSPINFEKLKKENTDIYAWLDIPGTEISYPLLQSPTDDTFYLNHSKDGKYSSAGSLFTEHRYNTTDFTDPVTAIYGHDMRSGKMFGKLQELYSDTTTFEELKSIIIYCPDKELRYEVFAAVPYNQNHILYYYDRFRTESAFSEFIDEIYSTKAFGTNFNEDIKLAVGDRVIFLSTCYKGNDSKRFLVLAKLVDEIN